METKVVDLVILNTLILEHDLTQFMAKLCHVFLTTTVNFLKFVHKLLLYVEMKVVELVILNTLILEHMT